MRRTSVLAYATLALTLIGGLLVQGPARAGDHCRRDERYAAYNSRSCRTGGYRSAGYYVSERSVSRCQRPRHVVYAAYRQSDRSRCERPRYSGYSGYSGYSRYDDGDRYRRCDRSGSYGSYDRGYYRDYDRRGGGDYYERRPRRSGAEIFVSLGAVFGGGHRRCR